MLPSMGRTPVPFAHSDVSLGCLEILGCLQNSHERHSQTLSVHHYNVDGDVDKLFIIPNTTLFHQEQQSEGKTQLCTQFITERGSTHICRALKEVLSILHMPIRSEPPFPFPSLPFPSLPFPSLPFPSLPSPPLPSPPLPILPMQDLH